MDPLQLEGTEREYAAHAARIHKDMIMAGWKKVRHAHQNHILYAYYEKNGYTAVITFGCNEDIKKEML